MGMKLPVNDMSAYAYRVRIYKKIAKNGQCIDKGTGDVLYLHI